VGQHDAREPGDLTLQERLRLMVENASDIVYQTRGLDITWISPSVTLLLGWAPEELIGGPAAALLSPNQSREWIELNRTKLAAGEDVYQELLLVAKDGSERWFAGTAHPYESDGASGFVVGMHDIQVKWQARSSLALAEELFRVTTRSAGEGIALVDSDGLIVESNEALSRFVGRSESDLAGVSWKSFVHPDDAADQAAMCMALLSGEESSHRTRVRFVHSSSAILFGDLSVAVVRSSDGSVHRLVLQIVDITDQTRARDQLTDLATIDPLTALMTRSAVLARIDEVLTGGGGRRDRLGVLLIDLDNLKVVNESLGRDAGDEVLSTIARRLSGAIDDSAFAGRISGKVFIVVVPGAGDIDGLVRAAERLSDVIGAEIPVQGRRVLITASTGAVMSRTGSIGMGLLRDADVALSEAKRRGGGRVQVFDEGFATAAVRRLVLEEELRDAIAHREFVVHYQPVVELGEHGRVGFEALVRWMHPVTGLRGPEAFLEVAEDSRQIRSIGAQVLRQVCTDLVAASTEMTMGVNVSAVELADPTWLPGVMSTLEETGVDPTKLVFEITETAVMSSRRNLRAELQELRDCGSGIHLDDFGTGYSSISVLRDLPVSGMKLDRSFVTMMSDRSGSGSALAEGLVGLAKALGIDGVAEGIETPDQADRLRDMGWTHGQGYHFGRPAPLSTWTVSD
jgi:diguanylate cyclase (GGDEF)-like protein/PAS domain S-box-containing protein